MLSYKGEYYVVFGSLCYPYKGEYYSFLGVPILSFNKGEDYFVFSGLLTQLVEKALAPTSSPSRRARSRAPSPVGALWESFRGFRV